jgi:hypothetical protein
MTLDSPSAPHPARFARHPLPFGEREKRYFVFENSAFSFGPVSALWRMTPSQPAW